MDTDWEIQSLRGVSSVLERVGEYEPQGIAISVITAAELYDGAFGADDQATTERTLTGFLRQYEILELDAETARIFGRERHRLRAMGQMIGDMDLLIAATALRHELTVLTNNRRHFERIEGFVIESA